MEIDTNRCIDIDMDERMREKERETTIQHLITKKAKKQKRI